MRDDGPVSPTRAQDIKTIFNTRIVRPREIHARVGDSRGKVARWGRHRGAIDVRGIRSAVVVERKDAIAHALLHGDLVVVERGRIRVYRSDARPWPTRAGRALHTEPGLVGGIVAPCDADHVTRLGQRVDA